MSTITGTLAKTPKDYRKLVAPFLKTNPELIELWERNLAKNPTDEHDQNLVKYGKEYLASLA